MPNPTPGVLATGKYSSRAVLVSSVGIKRKRGMGWTAIAKETGTSARTAKRCFEEFEQQLKQTRDQAYQLVRETAPPVKVPAPPALPPLSTPAPSSGFKGAVALYIAAACVVLAIVVVLISHR